MVNSTILDRTALAARLGVRPNTVTDAVRAGTIRPPDVRLGQTPGWYESTVLLIEQERRPVGRPRKVSTTKTAPPP